MTGLLANMVEGAVGPGWWVVVIMSLAIGFALGSAFRGWAEEECRREEAERIYRREIEEAKRRHPATRTDRGTYFDGT